MKKFTTFALFAVGLIGQVFAQYVADYDSVRGTLSLPWVRIGNDHYSNVILSVPSGRPWSLAQIGQKMNTVPSATAVYDNASSVLSIPAVSYQAEGTGVQTRSAKRSNTENSENGLTLVGGVDVSLANGEWRVLNTGSSVRATSTTTVSTVEGKITDRFAVNCSGTAPETCDNVGLIAEQAFGVDTDDDGAFDQVWQVGETDCLAIQKGVENGYAAATWLGDDAAEVGTVEAYIYPRPDGLYIMRYGSGTNWLSCAVIPVSGVSTVITNTSGGDVSVSNSQLSGDVGDTLSFYILGGTPPYTVISENSALASVSFGSVSSNKAQLVSVKLNSTGLSNADTATTQLFVFDWFQKTAPVNVTINKVNSASGAGALSIYPSEVENFSVGTRFQFKVLSGTAPFTVFNGLSDYIQVSQVATDTFEVYLSSIPSGTDELTGGLMITDAAGSTGSLSLKTIQPLPSESNELKLSMPDVQLVPGQTVYVAISGGRPPFNPINPDSRFYDVKLVSERIFSIKFKQVIGSVYDCQGSTENMFIDLAVLDSVGSMATMSITPQQQCGGIYSQYR